MYSGEDLQYLCRLRRLLDILQKLLLGPLNENLALCISSSRRIGRYVNIGVLIFIL